MGASRIRKREGPNTTLTSYQQMALKTKVPFVGFVAGQLYFFDKRGKVTALPSAKVDKAMSSVLKQLQGAAKKSSTSFITYGPKGGIIVNGKGAWQIPPQINTFFRNWSRIVPKKTP